MITRFPHTNLVKNIHWRVFGGLICVLPLFALFIKLNPSHARSSLCIFIPFKLMSSSVLISLTSRCSAQVNQKTMDVKGQNPLLFDKEKGMSKAGLSLYPAGAGRSIG